MSQLATTSLVLAATAMLSVAPSLHGEVTEYEDKSAWEAHIGSYTTLDFTGFDWHTIITDQYADLGAVFTDGDDWIVFGDGFPNDARGLSGEGSITVRFAQGQYWVGADFPGGLTIHLYNHGTWLYTSSDFAGAGHGYFAGLVSTDPFDEIILSDWVDGLAYIDDLHFGVPAPGAWCLMAMAGLSARRRRRH